MNGSDFLAKMEADKAFRRSPEGIAEHARRAANRRTAEAALVAAREADHAEYLRTTSPEQQEIDADAARSLMDEFRKYGTN